MTKLIVEMEMPRFCAECPMCDNVYYGDDVRKSFCVVFDERKEILTEDRPTWCPIKGVLPEDGFSGGVSDEITKEWERYLESERAKERIAVEEDLNRRRCELEELKRIVKHAEAVIAAERKER